MRSQRSGEEETLVWTEQSRPVKRLENKKKIERIEY